MNKYIVCTTINPPTEALYKFAKMDDWKLVIVCDKKTPSEAYMTDNAFRNSIILTPTQMTGMYPELSRMLGWNNVDIRNLGFLYAYENGADVVAMMDDDNIPLPGWGLDKNIHIGTERTPAPNVKHYLCKPGVFVFDPLSVYRKEDGMHWHRGYPIHLVPKRFEHEVAFETGMSVFDIQANLWNVELDFDAVCKMQDLDRPKPHRFVREHWYTSYQPSPFNMQNTMVSRRALKHCPSIPFTGRMCDIWGAYYCQAFGYRVLYGPPTVDHVQADRSWKSLCKDMEEEVLGYEHTRLAENMFEVGPREALRDVLPARSFEFVCAYEEAFD